VRRLAAADVLVVKTCFEDMYLILISISTSQPLAFRLGVVALKIC
jgi:hypothetical protein